MKFSILIYALDKYVFYVYQARKLYFLFQFPEGIFMNCIY
jgi:hypothetical protein